MYSVSENFLIKFRLAIFLGNNLKNRGRDLVRIVIRGEERWAPIRVGKKNEKVSVQLNIVKSDLDREKTLCARRASVARAAGDAIGAALATTSGTARGAAWASWRASGAARWRRPGAERPRRRPWPAPAPAAARRPAARCRRTSASAPG